MKVGLIGLGRMGEGMSRRMMKAGIEVWGYRRNYEKAQEAYEKGFVNGVTTSIQSLVQIVKGGGTQPGIFQMVIPAELVEETINELLRYCGEGDIIIDHGNSNFKDSRKRAERLAKLGIQYIDCGTSGGVYGLDRGYCLMVGGGNTAVSTCARIFDALSPGISAAPRTNFDSDITSAEHGWLHCGGPGAGHFVKMVHNGIEYAMMQAYAEGYELLEKKDIIKDVHGTFAAWQKGTVVRSWLLDLLVKALEEDPGLSKIQGYVDDSGEGRWTVEEAIANAVPMPAITAALFARFGSRQDDSPAMKAVAALRNQFGGHSVKKAE